MLFLLFKIGHDRFALDASRVVEVIPLLGLKRVTGSPHGVAGIINYRGQHVPALDLCELTLNRPAAERMSTRIVIIQCDECRVTGDVKASDPSQVTRHTSPRLLGLIVEEATGTLRKERADFSESLAGMPSVVWQATSEKKAASPVTRHPSPILMDGQGVIHLLDETRFLGEHLRDELFPPSLSSGAAGKQTVGLVDASD